VTDISKEYLDERFKAFEELLGEKLGRFYDRFDAECRKNGEIRVEVGKLQTWRADVVEPRLSKLERWPWLLGGLAAFISPVVVWAFIEMLRSFFSR